MINFVPEKAMDKDKIDKKDHILDVAEKVFSELVLLFFKYNLRCRLELTLNNDLSPSSSFWGRDGACYNR